MKNSGGGESYADTISGMAPSTEREGWFQNPYGGAELGIFLSLKATIEGLRKNEEVWEKYDEI